MKILLASAVGALPLMAPGVSFAQNANMMNGGMWGVGWMGGYGGIWVPILLVVAVVAVIAWVVKRNGK